MPTTDSPAIPSQSEQPTAPEHRPAIQIPDHELIRPVGRGSYGEVWLARNKMGTLRAVKIVRRSQFKDGVPFHRELAGIKRFEPISRSHEGFIDILHVGINEAEGYFYYVMELGDDKTRDSEIEPATYVPKTLASQIAVHGRVPAQECLEWGIALSSALFQLHKHGLVHRDVKPSNIIFVSGVPKLADIGLVADLSEARSFVGTEGFIPPEGPGKPQADIYALGKVLYEAMTGKDRLDFPSLPKDLDQLPPTDLFWELNAVILHSCQSEREERYESAWNLHTDLLFLTSGRSVKRLKELERLFATLKRAAIGALPFILIATIGGALLYRESRHRIEIRQRDVGMDLAYGNRAMSSGDLLGSVPYFVQALDLDKGDRQQELNHRLRIGSILGGCPKLTHLWMDPKELNWCNFSPDGKSLLVSEYFGKAKVYSLETDKPVGEPFGPESGLRTACYSPDGKFIATASENRSASVWDGTTFKKINQLSHPGPVFSARFSRDGRQLLTACADGKARLWNWESKQVALTISAHANAVLFAAFNDDDTLIVTGGADRLAKIWDARSGGCLHSNLLHGKWVKYAAFSPDSRKLVTGSNDHKARVWEVQTGRRIMPDLDHRDLVLGAEFSPDNRLILTASLDGTVQFWSADTLKPILPNPILRFPDRVKQAAFAGDGHTVGAVCADGSVWIWDLAGAQVPAVTNGFVFSGDGAKYLSLAGEDVRLFDRQSGQGTDAPAFNQPGLEKAGFNCDGSLVFTLSGVPAGAQTNHLLRVRRAGTGESLGLQLLLTNGFKGVALNGDGGRLATWAATNLNLWDMRTGMECWPAIGHRDGVSSSFFGARNNRLVSLAGRRVQVWDQNTGQACFATLVHTALVSYAEFSPDESHLLTCCYDGQFTKCYAQVWDAGTGNPIGLPLRHGDGVLFAAFSADGKKIVTASEDFTAIVWDAKTGAQLTSPMEHGNQITRAVFTPDCKWVSTAGSDATARLWDAFNGAPLTPPLGHVVSLVEARLWGSNLLTSDIRHEGWVWNIQSDGRPVEDLSRLAWLLTAGAVTPSDRLRRSSSRSLEAEWQFLRQKYSADFTAGPEQIIAWHRLQAMVAEKEARPLTALFHLEQLIASQGPQSDLIQRRDSARARLTDAQ